MYSYLQSHLCVHISRVLYVNYSLHPYRTGHLVLIPIKITNYSALSLCAWKAGDTYDAQRILGIYSLGKIYLYHPQLCFTVASFDCSLLQSPPGPPGYMSTGKGLQGYPLLAGLGLLDLNLLLSDS